MIPPRARTLESTFFNPTCQFSPDTGNYLCMSIPLSLSGKIALVTGGSRGIGAAAVRLFVAAGARVLFNYEKSKAPSEQLVKELGQENCAAVACNLSGTETAQAL